MSERGAAVGSSGCCGSVSGVKSAAGVVAVVGSGCECSVDCWGGCRGQSL